MSTGKLSFSSFDSIDLTSFTVLFLEFCLQEENRIIVKIIIISFIVFFKIENNVFRLPEGGDSKHFTVNQAKTLIEAQSLI